MSRPKPSDATPSREQMLLGAMRSVTLSFRLWMTEIVSRQGLTMGQYWTLADIADHQPVSSTQLAVFRCVKPPTVSVIVDELVQDGYVARQTSPKDRRVVALSSTPAGRDVLESVWRYVGEQLMKSTRDLPTRDIEAAVRVMNALQTNARVSVATAGAA
jgi:MarR family transcriptional regulator, organic hydroperoxide resistance regulator